jgi:hypothetical protein
MPRRCFRENTELVSMTYPIISQVKVLTASKKRFFACVFSFFTRQNIEEKVQGKYIAFMSPSFNWILIKRKKQNDRIQQNHTAGGARLVEK